MSVVLSQPGVDSLGEVVAALREWQHDDAPMQLHPGDLGWFWRFGPQATAAAIRTWSRNGAILGIGLLDDHDLLRLTLAPEAQQDEELAAQLVSDLNDPDRGLLPAGEAFVEAPTGVLVRDRLFEAGWHVGEPWTPLRRDLSEPVNEPAGGLSLRVTVIGPEQAHDPTSVHQASFDRSTLTLERWHSMAAGLPYADARCLVGYDDDGAPVATVTVWSAGPGKPGLLEPMGVDRDHRGRGYGRAITIAAAAALRELGSSSAVVCTASSRVVAVATYESAGFRQLPTRWDIARGR